MVDMVLLYSSARLFKGVWYGLSSVLMIHSVMHYSDDIRLAIVAWHSRNEDICGIEKLCFTINSQGLECSALHIIKTISTNGSARVVFNLHITMIAMRFRYWRIGLPANTML